MAYIRKRPNGTYQAQVYLGRDENGKRIFKYVTSPYLKECRIAAWETEKAFKEGGEMNGQHKKTS